MKLQHFKRPFCLLGLALTLSSMILLLSASETFAAGEGQLRIYSEKCTKVGGPIKWETWCRPFGFDGTLKVTGYNQHNTQVTWKSGPASFLSPVKIENWWWKFERGVNVTYIPSGQNSGYSMQIGNTTCAKMAIYYRENYIALPWGLQFLGRNYYTKCGWF